MRGILKGIIPFLLFLLLVPSIGNAQSKDDITGHHHEKDLRKMIAEGYIKGYGNGIYKPNNPITRGQFSAIIARALHLEAPDEGIGFTDVTEQSGVLEEVLAAAAAGLITGYDDGTFQPSKEISRQHMAAIVNRALNYLEMDQRSSNVTFKDQPSILYLSEVKNTVAYGIFVGSPINGELYFRPGDSATRGDAAAVITRFLNAVEKGEEIPPTEGEKPELLFSTAVVQANGSATVVKKFATYQEALSALKAGQVIQYGTTIINMPSGIVITKPTTASSLTNIYTAADFKSAYTYVSADTELEYVSSTDKYVEIKIAGKKGYIKHENSLLMPWSLVKERSYYTVTGGELAHYIYSHSQKKYVSYIAGKAPQFMKTGTKYYSWDGINFTNGNQNEVAYQYFQYLPARTVSQYTAEEIDLYIERMLKDLESKANLNPLYKDATQKSKLVGLGKYLKEVEKKHKINALHILALAQHESAYGLSTRAQEYNNLFGLKVYDDRPVAEYFESVEDNIDELMNSYWNKNYIPPTASYANGAAFGNKAIGFNVKYASDPYWGAKAAGHFYRIDKAMGGKELANPYKIGLTTTTGLNIRKDASTSLAAAYTYKNASMPVVIISEASPKPWLKIASDDSRYDELFVSGDYIKEIPYVK